jgi:acyl-CoA reductase-like NAD-dependent aldehyde dehydrogenase
MSRIDVRKTYKLFIGGAFPRSESGYTYVVSDCDGGFLANAAKASRKDARDAVEAATKAQPGWANRTAYNRGQILYRIAEMMETRVSEFAQLCSGEDEVHRAIDRIADLAANQP